MVVRNRIKLIFCSSANDSQVNGAISSKVFHLRSSLNTQKETDNCLSDKRSAPIDELWLHVMLAAIGETLENDNDGEVMGVVVNVRKGFYRIGLWTKTTGKVIPGAGDGDVAGGKGRSADKSKDILLGLGRRFKDVLKLKDAEVVEFSGHTESAHSGSTRAKAKFTV